MVFDEDIKLLVDSSDFALDSIDLALDSIDLVVDNLCNLFLELFLDGFLSCLDDLLDVLNSSLPLISNLIASIFHDMHKSWIRLNLFIPVKKQVIIVELFQEFEFLDGIIEASFDLDSLEGITDDSNKRVEPDDVRGNEEHSEQHPEYVSFPKIYDSIFVWGREAS